MKQSTTPVSFIGKHTFTQDEKNQKTEQMLQAMRLKEETEAEFKTSKSNYKSKLDAKEAEIKLIANLLNAGFEDRTYQCILTKNFEDGKRQFHEVGTGKLVGEEPLTAADYQMQLEMEEKQIQANDTANDALIRERSDEEMVFDKDPEYTVEPLSDPLEQTEEPTEAQVVNIDTPLKGKEVNKDKFEIKPAPPVEESGDPFGMDDSDEEEDPFSFGDI